MHFVLVARTVLALVFRLVQLCVVVYAIDTVLVKHSFLMHGGAPQC